MNTTTDFFKMTAVVAVVALAVYFGLDFLLPHQESTTVVENTGADRVFATDSSAALSSAPASASTTTPDTTPTTSPTPAVSESSHGTTADSTPPPAEPTAASAQATSAPASEPVQTAHASEVTPVTASEMPAPATHHKSAMAAEPATTPAAMPANGAANAVPAPKPPTSHHVAANAAAAPPSAFEVLNPWWTKSSGTLKVSFIGPAEGEHALVFLFGSDLGDASTAGQNIQLIDGKGKTLVPEWQSGGNAKVLVAKNLAAGRYTVVLKSALADSQGQNLGSVLSGAAYVR